MKNVQTVSDEVRGVLFDLDGTLLDSFHVHFTAYHNTFVRFGIRLTEDDFRQCYSPDWNRVYAAMGLPRTQWELASTYWLEEAAKEEAPLFKGVQELLAELRRTYALGLVTSGSRIRIQTDLIRTQLSECFRVVVTGDDVRVPKPSPEGLQIALKQLSLLPHQAVYVGDTEADHAMAKSADVEFLAVSSQFSPPGFGTACPWMKSILELRDISLHGKHFRTLLTARGK